MLSANQSTLQVFLKTAINITKIVICERILVPSNIDVTFFCLQENQCPTNCLKYWLIFDSSNANSCQSYLPISDILLIQLD